MLAICLDLDRLADGLEPEPTSDTVVEKVEMRILEFDHATAVNADEMVVRGLVDKVGIVSGLVFTEVDFPQQIRVHE